MTHNGTHHNPGWPHPPHQFVISPTNLKPYVRASSHFLRYARLAGVRYWSTATNQYLQLAWRLEPRDQGDENSVRVAIVVNAHVINDALAPNPQWNLCQSTHACTQPHPRPWLVICSLSCHRALLFTQTLVEEWLRVGWGKSIMPLIFRLVYFLDV